MTLTVISTRFFSLISGEFISAHTAEIDKLEKLLIAELELRDRKLNSPGQPKRTKIILVVSLGIFILAAAISIAVILDYNDYQLDLIHLKSGDQLMYLGYSETSGTVLNVHSYFVKGFLGIGEQPIQTVLVYVPAANVNFSENFLCHYYNVSDSVAVRIDAYNASVVQNGAFVEMPTYWSTISTALWITLLLLLQQLVPLSTRLRQPPLDTLVGSILSRIHLPLAENETR